MSETPAMRTFQCCHCGVDIQIPADLPPTTAPCPKCKQVVTSPALEEEEVVPVLHPVQDSGSSGRREPSVAAEELSEAVEAVDSGAVIEGQDSLQKSGREGAWRLLLPIGLLGLGMMVVAFVFLRSGGHQEEVVQSGESSLSKVEERREISYREQGWVEEAKEVLRRFLTTESVEERAALTIGGSENEARMARLDESLLDRDYPISIDAFSPVWLEEEDAKRGIFLMNYSRPQQVAMRSFFRPVSPIRVSYGLEKPDNLLLTEGAISNFLEEPVRVLAFFRKTSEGMKLDWQTFVQTRFRLFDSFLTQPSAGKKGVFRVSVEQDVRIGRKSEKGVSVFRLSDPANREDFVKILVEDESELGRALAPLKWLDRVVSRIPVRNATVGLMWSHDVEPKLKIEELISWEFIGLGGERGNWKTQDSE